MCGKLVSIIIPAYNAEAYIGRAVESLLAQDYQNIEIIVVNDGSDDHTETIVEEIANAEHRVKIFVKENGGVSSARNLGLIKAEGDYVVFVDADDWVAPNYISFLVNMIEKNQVELSICGIASVSSTCIDVITGGHNGKYDSLGCARALLLSKGIVGQPTNKLFLKDIIDSNHLRFNEKLSNAEDLLFQMEYVRYIKEAYYQNEPLYQYAVVEGSASHGFCEGKKIRSSRLTELVAYQQINEIYPEQEIQKLVRDKENHLRMEIIKTILENDLDETELYHEYKLKMLKRIGEVWGSEVEPVKGKIINMCALLFPVLYQKLKKRV